MWFAKVIMQAKERMPNAKGRKKTSVIADLCCERIVASRLVSVGMGV